MLHYDTGHAESISVSGFQQAFEYDLTRTSKLSGLDLLTGLWMRRGEYMGQSPATFSITVWMCGNGKSTQRGCSNTG